jgi:hypothetical protein
MAREIVVGSVIILISIAISGLSLWVVETWIRRAHGWLTSEPHGAKMFVLLSAAAIWILFILSAGIWLWAVAFRLLGLFPTIEEAVFFALVSFTTLGDGGMVLPRGWRLLGGMAAANGLMSFSLLMAMLVEALRHVRVGQVERRHRD